MRQYYRRHWQRLIPIALILLLVTSCYRDCHALASSPRGVVSHRNGRSKSFYFDNETDNKDDDNDSNVKLLLHQVGLFRPSDVLRQIQTGIISTFLPSIPSSSSSSNILSSSGYLRYILLDNIQDLCTSLRSVLATQRILEGVGVGRADATALSATLNFLIRDGCGMMASLLFTSYAASSFRRNVKRWKFFADVMVDIGITLEIIAPSVLSSRSLKGWFLPLICLANVCKALCGVAAGACGGAFQLYWSMTLMGSQDGISEVSAKSGAQRTVMGGAGLVLAGLLAKSLGSGHVSMVVWFGFYSSLTSIHLVSNWMSLKLVALDWLNSWRLHFVVDQFLNSVDGAKNEINKAHVLSTPLELSKIEPLLFLARFKRKNSCPIEMGVSFNQFARMSHHTAMSLQSLLSQQQKQNNNYIVTVGHTDRRRLKQKRRILIALSSNYTKKDMVRAYLHACLVARELSSTSMKCHNDVEEIEMVKEAEIRAENKLGQLCLLFESSALKAGWNLDRTEVSTKGYEITCYE